MSSGSRGSGGRGKGGREGRGSRAKAGIRENHIRYLGGKNGPSPEHLTSHNYSLNMPNSHLPTTLYVQNSSDHTHDDTR